MKDLSNYISTFLFVFSFIINFIIIFFANKIKLELQELLKDYVKKEDAVTHEELLKHQISCKECNNKDYASVQIVSQFMDRIEKLETKIDDLIKFLMEKQQ